MSSYGRTQSEGRGLAEYPPLKKLAAYCRTSTQNGAGGDSLQAQEDACREWASANGHDLMLVFRDASLSGALGVEDRPGLAASLVALDDGIVEGLVVHRPDRLARELHVQEVALAHVWAAGDHVRVFEAAEGAEIVRDDPNDPQRRFLRQVMGAAAELERGLIKARLQGGRRRKAGQGGYIGGKRLHRRFGYELVRGEYVPVPQEQVIIDDILTRRDEGATWDGIADTLNQRGVKPPSGAVWYAMTVRRIALRER
jgi:DNA invertase Pin-like site-specific DNA recombinase